MFNVLCVTNRRLCEGDFLSRIEKIAKHKPAGILLREKDLAENEYEQLAREVLAICRKYETDCILHNFPEIALRLNHKALHLPLNILRSLTNAQKSEFLMLGASCHSLDDAKEAESLGCAYITAGHIFDTNCKKGLPGRGMDFLRKICDNVSIPVYAIGGISKDNIAEVKNSGASGAAVMSGIMASCDIDAYLDDLSI